MKRWITALVAGIVALGCGSEPTRPARGPQTPELPTARRTAPLDVSSAGEATAGYGAGAAASRSTRVNPTRNSWKKRVEGKATRPYCT